MRKMLTLKKDLKVSDWFFLNFIMSASQKPQEVKTIRDLAHSGARLSYDITPGKLSRDQMMNVCQLAFDVFQDMFQDPSSAWQPEFSKDASEENVIDFSQHVKMGESYMDVISNRHSSEFPAETASCGFANGIDDGQISMEIWSNDVGTDGNWESATTIAKLRIPAWYAVDINTPIIKLAKQSRLKAP
ncbi:hypothetical protein [Oryzifoliimicrobium ureilyticus]|uniref:hypothetical protein n=1 Tax=Oryzifoliimicrobium ureilyticus TaxID=3113724 RepID=UPI003075F86D